MNGFSHRPRIEYQRGHASESENEDSWDAVVITSDFITFSYA